MPLSENIKNKLRGMGVEPEQVMQQLGNYIGEGKAFATPQDYATGIQAKQAAGQALTDPATAGAFRTMAPQMFGEEPQQQHTEFHFPVGQIPAMGIQPQARSMLEGLAQYQQANPFTIPYAPGTPTIAQTEAERAAGQWDQTFEEGTRQFDLAHDLSLRQQEHREWLDRQNLALSRASAAAGSAGLPTSGPESPWGAIDMAIQAGFDANELTAYVSDPRNIATYKQYGWNQEDALDYALGRFEQTWSGIAEKERGLVHWSDPLETMYDKVRHAEDMLAPLPGMRGGFTENDYQKFAGETGRTVEEIRRMDELGWLEDFMKSYYSTQYKPQDEIDPADAFKWMREQGYGITPR